MVKISYLSRPLVRRRLRVYTDGAIRPERQVSGLAAVVVDEQGHICYWWSRLAGPMTNNEAEYAAIIFALQRLLPLRPFEITVYSDSHTVVEQMSGRAHVHAEKLRQAYHQTCTLVASFPRVTFHYIPRRRNRLADALANETVDGFLPQITESKE